MNKTEILEKVSAIITDKMCEKPENVKSEANLKDDLGMDSLDVVELVMEVEKEFKISISDNEYDGITTVGSVVDLVESKQK